MKTFLQIGAASDGAWGIERLKKGYIGYFVEPHPGNVVELHRVLSEKQLLNQCEIFQIGIWEKSGIQRFNIVEKFLSDATVSSHLDVTHEYYTKKEEKYGKPYLRKTHSHIYIFCITLSDLLSLTGYCHEVRIDIEGAEVPILKNHLWQELPDRLYVEYHGMTHINDTEKVLYNQGFVNSKKGMNRVYEVAK